MAVRHWTTATGALMCALALSACQQKLPTLPAPSAPAKSSAPAPSAPAPSSAEPTPSPTTPEAKTSFRPVKVTLLGDSITAATFGRHVLYDAAAKAGWNVAWTGAVEDDSYTPPAGLVATPGASTAKPRLSAWGGYTIGCADDKCPSKVSDVYSHVEEALQGDPDVCAMEIGTNDNYNDNGLPNYQPNGPEGLQRYADLLDHMHAVSPNCHILAATVLPVKWDLTGYMKTFNDGLAGIVATRPWASVIDLAKDVHFTEDSYGPDGLHPADDKPTSGGWGEYGDALFQDIGKYLSDNNLTKGVPVVGGSATTAPSGSSDGATLNSDLLLANQQGSHDGWMKGVPHNYSWAPGPEANVKYPDADSCLAWGQIYLDEAGPTTNNTRVEIKDFELWELSKSQNKWVRIAGPSGAEGAAYPVNFQGDSAAADVRSGDAGDAEFEVTDNGRNAHFWAKGGSTDCNLSDAAAVVGLFQARGVTNDASKPADIDEAKLLVSGGVDYRKGGATGQIVDSLGLGKAHHVTVQWQYLTVTNATKDQLTATPFPAVQ